MAEKRKQGKNMDDFEDNLLIEDDDDDGIAQEVQISVPGEPMQIKQSVIFEESPVMKPMLSAKHTSKLNVN